VKGKKHRKRKIKVEKREISKDIEKERKERRDKGSGRLKKNKIRDE